VHVYAYICMYICIFGEIEWTESLYSSHMCATHDSIASERVKTVFFIDIYTYTSGCMDTCIQQQRLYMYTTIQPPIPLAVTFSNAVSKLKAQSSNVSPPKDGEIALCPSTNGAFVHFLVLPGSLLSISEITEYKHFSS